MQLLTRFGSTIRIVNTEKAQERKKLSSNKCNTHSHNVYTFTGTLHHTHTLSQCAPCHKIANFFLSLDRFVRSVSFLAFVAPASVNVVVVFLLLRSQLSILLPLLAIFLLLLLFSFVFVGNCCCCSPKNL